MRFLYERGHPRRVMHLCGYSPITGKPTMQAMCGSRLPFNMTCNLPLGRATCKACLRAVRAGAEPRSEM